ncbi:hypothetical protein RKE29_11910 [Streptomyces sp. B1866]|uniref:hypothetical protein n=1 Tax=Streptomyces sp. B1866 TaxID=3075431 RepID=UPI00288FEAAA|nr:hypothetical protein [Streptomyces sp. B1866]MDT3397345.1 hypothetical protein [Streptomyces sp. B1866]
MSPRRGQRPGRARLYLVPAEREYDDAGGDAEADLRAAAMLEAVARATEAADVSRAHRLLRTAPPPGAEPGGSWGRAPFALREYAAELTDALRDVLAAIESRAPRLGEPAPYGPITAERLRMATILVGHMWSALGNEQVTAHQMRVMNRQLRESLRAAVAVADELGHRLDGPGPDDDGLRCRKGGTT